MTLTETLRSALAQQVTSTWDFQFDAAADQWTVQGTVTIASPEAALDLRQEVSWQFANRQLTSHIPKLRLEQAMTDWGLAQHPRARELFELIDMQFRNERQKLIDTIFSVYKPGDPTNF